METDYKALCEKLRTELATSREDVRMLEAKEINDHYTVGVIRERKIDRQKKALHNLNRRVRVQRLQLRKLNEMERGLRPDEWVALKAEYAHELEEDNWNIGS